MSAKAVLIFSLFFALIFFGGCAGVSGLAEPVEVKKPLPRQICNLHSDCPKFYGSCGGGGMCAPNWHIYCDNGICRAPANYGEWEMACQKTGASDMDNCFEITARIAKEKVGYKTAFEVCNRNYATADEAEFCRLRVCGYYQAYPEIYPGEEACVKEAISSTCADGRRNGRESDIDCGLFECEPCENGKNCRTNNSCKSGACNLHSVSNPEECIPICPDGPIKENAPCGCRVEGEIQDYERESAESWENTYSKGRALFCCGGILKSGITACP